MRCPALSSYDLLSHDLIEELLRDTETFTSVGGYAHLPAVPDELRDRLPHGWPHFGTAGGLTTTDPPEHTPVRKLANKALSPRAVVALEPRARQAAVAALGRVYDEGRGDLLADVIKPFPFRSSRTCCGAGLRCGASNGASPTRHCLPGEEPAVDT